VTAADTFAELGVDHFQRSNPDPCAGAAVVTAIQAWYGFTWCSRSPVQGHRRLDGDGSRPCVSDAYGRPSSAGSVTSAHGTKLVSLSAEASSPWSIEVKTCAHRRFHLIEAISVVLGLRHCGVRDHTAGL
jgi:hypothetical protein